MSSCDVDGDGKRAGACSCSGATCSWAQLRSHSRILSRAMSISQAKIKQRSSRRRTSPSLAERARTSRSEALCGCPPGPTPTLRRPDGLGPESHARTPFTVSFRNKSICFKTTMAFVKSHFVRYDERTPASASDNRTTHVTFDARLCTMRWVSPDIGHARRLLLRQGAKVLSLSNNQFLVERLGIYRRQRGRTKRMRREECSS
jgi:hypothetical protein